MFWEPFTTQGSSLGGGKVQSDPQEEAKALLLKKAEQWNRTVSRAFCIPQGW